MHTIVDIFKGIGETAVVPLTGKLRARDDYVRRLAIRCLGEIRSPLAIESLISMAGHADFRTRGGVMRALGQIGDSRSAEYVTKGLFDRDELVATSAAVACGQIKNGIDPIALIEALDHPYFGVRYSAMKSLMELGEISVGPLIQYVQSRPLDISTGYAIEALGKIGSKRALNVFKQTIKSDNWAVRAYTAEALGDLNQKKASKIIGKALKSETHPLVKHKLLNSLAVYKDQS
jgi:HEAT repeat protein